MSELLSALQESWGVPGQVDNIRALLSLFEQWSKDVNNEALLESLSLSIEHLVMEELETASFSAEGLPPQAGQHLTELTKQFEILARCLEELDEALQERDLSEASSLAAQIRQTAQQVGETRAGLEEWMQNPEPCCLSCGGTQESEGLCPECEVELMVPNLTPNFSNVNVQLEPQFYAIYERYKAIGRGQASLSSILDLLPPAEEHLKEMGKVAKNVNRKPEDADVRDKLYEASEEVLGALAQIRAATHSKRKVDLDQAWQNTAQALVKSGQALSQLMERLGVDVTSDDGGDHISLESD